MCHLSTTRNPNSTRKRKKKKDESISSSKVDKVSTFKKTPNMKGTCYEPETERDLDEDKKREPENMMADIMAMAIEE